MDSTSSKIKDNLIETFKGFYNLSYQVEEITSNQPTIYNALFSYQISMYERNILSMINAACEIKEYIPRYRKINNLYNAVKKIEPGRKSTVEDLLMNLRVRPLYFLKLITIDDFSIDNMEINHNMSFIYSKDKSPVSYDKFDDDILLSINASHMEILTRRNYLTHRTNKVDKQYIKRSGLKKNLYLGKYLLKENMFKHAHGEKILSNFDNLTIDISVNYFRYATMNITQLFFIMYSMTYNKIDISTVENLLSNIINIGLGIFNNDEENRFILEGCNVLSTYYQNYIENNEIDSPYLIAAIIILREKLGADHKDCLANYESLLARNKLGKLMIYIIRNDIDNALDAIKLLLKKGEIDKETFHSNYIFQYISHSMKFRNLYKSHFKVEFQLSNYNKVPII